MSLVILCVETHTKYKNQVNSANCAIQLKDKTVTLVWLIWSVGFGWFVFFSLCLELKFKKVNRKKNCEKKKIVENNKIFWWISSNSFCNIWSIEIFVRVSVQLVIINSGFCLQTMSLWIRTVETIVVDRGCCCLRDIYSKFRLHSFLSFTRTHTHIWASESTKCDQNLTEK